jgi:ABC-type lipoprotein export system ATPase subunit
MDRINSLILPTGGHIVLPEPSDFYGDFTFITGRNGSGKSNLLLSRLDDCSCLLLSVHQRRYTVMLNELFLDLLSKERLVIEKILKDFPEDLSIGQLAYCFLLASCITSWKKIILIDTPELYLDTEHQLMLMGNLHLKCPGKQFIIATNSAHITANFPQEHIIELSLPVREKKK